VPIQHSLWTVSGNPSEVTQGILPSEQLLEDMIVAEPRILSSEWMLIGRQVETGQGGRLDLLAIAPDGSLVLIELKRDRTPREVVAHALDYAAWVESLDAEDITRIYRRFQPDRSLPVDAAAEQALKKRTLTNLYNERPTWLDNDHKALDAAVATAYGWDDYSPDMPNEEILSRLLALNLERAERQA